MLKRYSFGTNINKNATELWFRVKIWMSFLKNILEADIAVKWCGGFWFIQLLGLIYSVLYLWWIIRLLVPNRMHPLYFSLITGTCSLFFAINTQGLFLLKPKLVVSVFGELN